MLSRTRFEVHVLCGDQTRPTVGFPLYPFRGTQFCVVEQTRPSAGVRNRHSEWFCFPAVAGVFCRAVQADFVRRFLSVPFALSAHRFLCVWSETVNLKVNTSVDESDSAR